MLKATKKLHELLISEDYYIYDTKHSKDFSIEFIVENGSKEDLDFLFPYALKEIEYFNSIFLIVMTFGKEYHAKKLYEVYTENDRLKYENSGLLLHSLGYLGYQESIEMLMYYLDGPSSRSDKCFNYDYMVYSALGLLSLDCSEFKKEIENKIFSYKGKGIFNEFMPALASKIDNKEILEFIYKLGNEDTSPDCLNGIVLGISLFSERGKEVFAKVLFNPNWEPQDVGSGISHYLTLGLRILNYPLKEIFKMFKTIILNKDNNFDIISDAFEVIKHTLSGFIYQKNSKFFIKGVKEYKIDFFDIYNTFFIESSLGAKDSIVDLAEEYLNDPKEDDLYFINIYKKEIQKFHDLKKLYFEIIRNLSYDEICNEEEIC